MAAGVVSGTTALPAFAGASVSPPPSPHQQFRSSPPDRTIFRGTAPRGPVRSSSVSGVFVIDATAAASSTGGNEPSIAVNPANPNQIAITRFNTAWNSNADLLFSADGGVTWANETSIPVPPGVAGTSGCPCDQTIDYGRNNTLYGTFLTFTTSATSVVTGSTTDPTTAASWSWNGNPAQLTTGTRTNVDQPWLLVNRDPATASQDDVYVGYDDFGGSPDARVAVSYGASPVNITADNKAGTESPLATNPGFRLAADPRNGTMYALYEQSTGSTQPKSVTYKLNRSTDGGATWTLNGSADGLTVDTVNSDQAPGFKFGGVNALLGGVDHAAVDPSNGDVYVAYGQDVSGGNQIRIRRLTPNGSGGLSVGPASNVSSSTNAALPSVAVTTDGTIGVLYDTFDGTTTTGFPIFSAHLARSTDHGATFSDVVLDTFQSPATSSSNARQRVLGDYQQLKAVGTTFYGTFPGNTSGVPATNPPIDAMFFTVPQSTTMSLSSSANPSVFGQPVTFTAKVTPVPDGGTVSFAVDSSPLGGPVPVNTTTGQATSASIATLTPGTHTVTATYSGDANFKGATATLTQQVTKAPVTTTLTSSGPSHFGHKVTFTDTVCPAPPSASPSAPPTGKVAFRDGAFLLGRATLSPGGGTNCSQARLSWSNLLPRTHNITAKYGGDTNYLANGLEHLSQVVKCTRTITGNIHGTIHAHGESTCVVNANVHGSVLSGKRAALFVGNSTITGSVQSRRGTLFGMCRTKVHGSVIVTHASRFVVIGDPRDDGCALNRIRGQVSLRSNRGDAELARNHIRGTVNVRGNSGTGPFPEDSATEIEANTIGGSLHCTGNVPPPTNDGHPNAVAGSRTHQCAGL
jgi:Bacterial Ig-like domain (group 3)